MLQDRQQDTRGMSAPTRIGLVGLGRFGVGFHLRRLLAMGAGVTIASLCDRSPERLAARDERLADCHTCTDFTELIDPDRVDGVIVSTPNPEHFAPCKLAIERGVPVMVDKPTTVTAADAEILVRLSHEQNVPFITAFTRHFFPAVEFVREQIRNGGMGDVLAMEALQLGCPPNERPQDGGFLHQRNVHLFDLIPWLTGSSIAAVEARVSYDGPWETFADMHLFLASGTSAHFLSLSDTAQNQDEISIYGSQAIYRIQREQLFVNQQRGLWEQKQNLPESSGSSTTHFVDIVRHSVPAAQLYCERHGDDGLRAIRVLEAVVTSGRTGKRVELPT